MNINDTFPSKFLKASDLKGTTPTVTIARIEIDKIGEDQKPVLYFVGKEKGMVLNKTNANNIASLYSPETDNWIGKNITLYEALVDFQGRSVPALRARGPQGGASIVSSSHDIAQPAPDHPNAPGNDGDLDDEIPF